MVLVLPRITMDYQQVLSQTSEIPGWHWSFVDPSTASPFLRAGTCSDVLILLVLNAGNGWVAGGCWDDKNDS